MLGQEMGFPRRHGSGVKLPEILAWLPRQRCSLWDVADGSEGSMGCFCLCSRPEGAVSSWNPVFGVSGRSVTLISACSVCSVENLVFA